MSTPLDSRQLKAFVTLARTGSLTETAKELFLTHSAISHSMKALENDTGCRLLTRVGKKLELTEAGEALLDHAKRIVGEMGLARAALKQLNEWGTQRLRLGAEASLGTGFLPGVLADLKTELPRARIMVVLAEPSAALALLETNQVDLVLSEKPKGSGRFEFAPLFEDRFQIVVNASHPWVALGGVPRAELSKQPCVLSGETTQDRHLIQEYFAEEGIVLNTDIEVSSAEAAKQFVKQGLGAGILPRWVTRGEVADGSLFGFSVGRKHLTQSWGLVSWPGRPWNHAQAAFVKLCQKAGSSFVTEKTPGRV